jgi:hypothetical protein
MQDTHIRKNPECGNPNLLPDAVHSEPFPQQGRLEEVQKRKAGFAHVSRSSVWQDQFVTSRQAAGSVNGILRERSGLNVYERCHY